MSQFKKMRLVKDDQSTKNQIEYRNPERFTTSTNVQRMGDLDNEINEILESKVPESTKAKLYRQALKKFLTFKELHREEQSEHNNHHLDLIKKLSTPIIKKVKRKNKTLSTPRKPIKKLVQNAPKKTKKRRVLTNNLKVIKASTSKSNSNVYNTPAWDVSRNYNTLNRHTNKMFSDIVVDSSDDEFEEGTWFEYGDYDKFKS
jgi:hypothetical protein